MVRHLKASQHIGCWIAIATLGWLVGDLGVLAQEPKPQEQEQEIRSWVTQLTDASYSTRQIAYWRLIRQGSASVPYIEEALKHADADAAERMIRILNELAIDPNSGPGRMHWLPFVELPNRASPSMACWRREPSSLWRNNNVQWC